MDAGIYYAQQIGCHYLSEDDTDGDWLTRSLVHADLRKEPWYASHGSMNYHCIKVQIINHDRSMHPRTVLKVTKVKGKTRYYYMCPRCNEQTKRYSSADTAFEKWNDKPALCRVTEAKRLEDVTI